jgi:CBS domain-containing protein
MLTTTVAQILSQKGSQIFSVAPDTPVLDALGLLAEKNIGALLVLDAGNLVGIFSERDYARKIALQNRSSSKTPVRAIMSERVVCVRPNETAEECMALMSDKHIRHLPVLGDGSPIGIISIGDVVKAVIAEQDFAIHQLENYIAGSR